MACFKRLLSTILFALCRSPMKESCAEFLGTFFLVLCGDGVMASITLGRLGQNATIVSSFGWGLSLGIGIWIAGRVSGGHLNPAVTTAFAVVKKCPWKHVVPYLLSQYLASFLAAAVIYSVYHDAIAEFDNGFRQLPPGVNSTAEIFSTYPKDSTSVGTLFVDQVVGTALLLIVICTATDGYTPAHIQPLIISLGLTAIALAFGHNCGAPLNPARDLSPRLFTAFAGWGMGTFSVRGYMWFWIPVVGPHVGALLGVWLYDLFIDMPFRNYALLEEVAISSGSLERSKDDILPRVTAATASKSLTRPLGVKSMSSDDYFGRRLMDRSPSPEETLDERSSQRESPTAVPEKVFVN